MPIASKRRIIVKGQAMRARKDVACRSHLPTVMLEAKHFFSNKLSLVPQCHKAVALLNPGKRGFGEGKR